MGCWPAFWKETRLVSFGFSDLGDDGVESEVNGGRHEVAEVAVFRVDLGIGECDLLVEEEVDDEDEEDEDGAREAAELQEPESFLSRSRRWLYWGRGRA